MKKTIVGLTIDALLLLLLAGSTGMAAAASSPAGAQAGAGQAYIERFQFEDSEEIEDLCDETGLTVQHTFALDMFVHVVQDGPDRFDYFLQYGVWTETYTHN